MLSMYYQEDYGSYTSPLTSAGLTASMNHPAIEFIAGRVRERLGGSARVVEVGGFDGYVLAQLQDVASSLLLIEPSEHGSRIAGEHGLPVLNRTLDDELAEELRGQFDVVISRHVVEHVRDPYDFVRQLSSLLSPDGLLFLETPDLSQVLNRLFVRTIMLEHLDLYSPMSLNKVIESFGLVTTGLEFIEDYAFMIEAGRHGDAISVDSRPIDDPSRQEALIDQFMDRLEAYVADLSSVVQKWRAAGKNIWIWGAGTAAGELFNIYAQQSEDFRGYIDSDPRKAGMVLSRAPSLAIHTPEDAYKQGIDAVLITSYSISEITASIRERGWDVDVADIYNPAN